MGAVPAKARGLRHTAPTYLRRRPGSPSNGLLGSALGIFRNSAILLDLDQRRSEKSPTPRGPCAPPRGGVGRPRGFRPASRQEGLRLARLWRPRVVSAFHPLRDEPDTLELLQALAAEDFATALPVVVGRGSALTFRLWRPGDPTRTGSMSIAEPLETAPAVDPDLLFVPLACFDRRGHRIGYGAGYYDRSLARLRAMKAVHAVGVAYGVCRSRRRAQ